jgi:hypothetical protein
MKTFKTNILALPRLSASLFLNYSAIIAIFPVLALFLSLSACSNGAPTVIPATVKTTNPENESGILVPRIQAVSPGTLQSLTTPNAVTTNVSTTNPGIVVVFSHVMENDGGEMSFSFELLNGALSVPFTIYPPTHASAFAIKPSGALSDGTTYTLRIRRNCYIDGFPTRILEFTNLDSTSNPLTTTDYVDYEFTTGTATPAALTPPQFGTSTPANASTGITPTLGGTNCISFNFSYILPTTALVDPSTVNDSTVTLYNATDGFAVSGQILCTDTATFGSYEFYPSAALDYGKNYIMTLSAGDGIKDITGNVMTMMTVQFQTLPLTDTAAPVPGTVSVTAVTSTTATVVWSTDSVSIAHSEIKSGNTFTSPADQISHNSSLGVWFTATFTGLTPNTDYSIRINADNDTSKTAAGPFDNVADSSCIIHTPPDSTDGATGNYALSTGGAVRTNLNLSQINDDESFAVWQQGPNSIIQYMNSSSGTADTWDKWTSGGETIFSSAGTLDTISDGSDGVIITRTSGVNIYANRIRNNSGSMQIVWGNSTTGKSVYTGGAAVSTARAAITYSGYVSTVTSGTASMNYLYDPSANFSAYTGYHVINETETTRLHSLATSADTSFIETASQIINLSNKNYRIASSIVHHTGTEAAASSGNFFYSLNTFTVGDIIHAVSGSDYVYITAFTPTNTYTVNPAINALFGAGASLESFSYAANGTAATNALFNSGSAFPVINQNDIAMNATTGEWDKTPASPLYAGAAAANRLLLLNNVSKFVFNTTDPYRVMRLPAPADFIEGGRVSSVSSSDITQASRDFIALGVQPGDIVYSPAGSVSSYATYAKIVSIPSNDTLRLSRQICSTGDPFIIFRKNMVSFVWSESGSVYISSVGRDDGNSVFSPVTVNIGPGTNPFIVSDRAGNGIVVYENGGAISAKKVRGDGFVLWTSANIVPATAYIKKIQSDSTGGVWILYTSDSAHASTAGLAHIGEDGTTDSWHTNLIPDSSNADMTVLDTTHAGVVYELSTPVSGSNYKRIHLNVYASSSLTPSGSSNVQSVDTAASQLNPRISPDRSLSATGGAIVSWVDTRYASAGGSVYTLFAQHFNSSYGLDYSDYTAISVPYKSSNANTADPYAFDQRPVYYTNGAVNAGLFFWLDGRTASNMDVYCYPLGN